MVWKRSDDPPSPTPSATPTPSAPPPRPLVSQPAPVPEAPRRNDRTVIGPSIFIKGDLSGEEDVLVEGRVEGKIEFQQNSITVGTSGKVKADLYGRTVTVEGQVDGNVFAREQAVVRPSGTVQGNISAPRVVLEDGAKFKGSIDMDSKESPRPVSPIPASFGALPSATPLAPRPLDAAPAEKADS